MTDEIVISLHDLLERRMHEVSIASIDPSYFEVLRTPVLAGRAFHAGDLAPEARVVIVDQGFVDRILGGRSAVGRLEGGSRGRGRRCSGGR